MKVRWQAALGVVRRDRADDPERFRQAVLAHLPAAYSLARWLVRDATLAQDVVQEAVLRALTYFATRREDGDSRAWFLRIVRNAAFDTLARRPRAETQDDDAAAAMPDPSDDPEAALGRRQRGETLERLVAGLADDLRECLVLREFEGLSYREISLAVGVPIGTVMSRLFRARQALLAGAKPQ